MKTELEINEMILGITNKIRKSNPELLNYLNEMPVTIPHNEKPEITIKVLTSYYESLVVLLEEYENHHAENLLPNKIEDLSKTENNHTKIANCYEDLITEINNFTVSYNDVGKGSIPIIFLHGFPFDKSMWKGQLDNLKTVSRVIAIDIRGFGKSTNQDTSLSIDLFSEDLMAFMDKLKIKKAIVCGLSMGGFIALNAIKRFPERFEALILCDTQCIADTTEVKENRYKAIEQIKKDDATAFNEKFIKNVFHPNSIINKTELVESLSLVVYANPKEIIIGGLIALAERSETCSGLSAISIPTLIICGREDIVTPLAQSEFMHTHIKKSSLNIINNAGHVSNLEQPEEFNKYLFYFLNSLGFVSN